MSRYTSRAVNKQKRKKTRVRIIPATKGDAAPVTQEDAAREDAAREDVVVDSAAVCEYLMTRGPQISAGTTHRHCDEYIDDEAQPSALRAWLDWGRSPGHGYTMPKPWPVLFADWVDRGGTIQLVMTSRFGDVGVTRDLSADPGPYEDRVYLDQLTNFRSSP